MITRQMAQDACASLADVFTASGDAGTVKTIGSRDRVYVVGRDIEGWYPLASLTATVYAVYRQDIETGEYRPDALYSEHLINRSDAVALMRELRTFQPLVKRQVVQVHTN